MKVELKKIKETKFPSHCLSLVLGDDEKVYASCYDGGVYCLDGSEKKPKKIVTHENISSGVKLCGDNIISSDYDGIIKWSDRKSHNELRKIKAHDFWSWQSAVSRDEKKIASVTGQYLVGGYKYEPASEKEPSVKVYDSKTGDLTHSFSHQPPVQSIAFSNNSRFLAAGNLMGEVRVWDLINNKLVSKWNTEKFTGWGIIKGHYYTGGIFSIEFSPDDLFIYVAGMGTTRDPAAGNGKQLWEKYRWPPEEGDPELISSALDSEIGQGLMEVLTFHPSEKFFLMAGRMFKGNWNTAIFDSSEGKIICSENSGIRCSDAVFNAEGTKMFIGGGKSQGKIKDGRFSAWGRVLEYEVSIIEEKS